MAGTCPPRYWPPFSGLQAHSMRHNSAHMPRLRARGVGKRFVDLHLLHGCLHGLFKACFPCVFGMSTRIFQVEKASKTDKGGPRRRRNLLRFSSLALVLWKAFKIAFASRPANLKAT